MGGVRVVTDSACDLTPELADGHDIAVVPLSIRFGSEELLDRRDLSPEEFWRRCEVADVLPETAAPAPGAFVTAFEEAAEEGAAGVLCLCLSSGVSATYQAALNAARQLTKEIPVQVLDTRSLTMGQGLMAIAAAEQAADGMPLEQLTDRARRSIDRTYVYGVVDTLDHLQKGGRIGGAAALVGSLLSIKPVIQVRDGVVEQESRQRTRARSLDYLAQKVAGDAPLDRLAVCNGAAEDIATLLDRLADVKTEHPMVTVDLGPVVGTHAGPGAIGVCYQVPEGR